MSTALQEIIANQRIKEVIRKTPLRKESGTTPSEAIVAETEKAQAKKKTKKQQQQAIAAAARSAARAKRNAAQAERAQIFVRELVAQGFNSTEAYLVIHPKAKRTTARTNGPRMLSDAHVQNVLAAYLIDLRKKYALDFGWIWRAWVRASLANPVAYFESRNGQMHLRDLTELPEDLQMNLKKVKVTRVSIPMESGPPEERQTIEIEVIDQQKAVEQMAKALGMFMPDDDGGSAESMIADMIRGAAARIKSRADLTAHRVVSEQ